MRVGEGSDECRWGRAVVEELLWCAKAEWVDNVSLHLQSALVDISV